jgi:hypothetical protein
MFVQGAARKESCDHVPAKMLTPDAHSTMPGPAPLAPRYLRCVVA